MQVVRHSEIKTPHKLIPIVAALKFACSCLLMQFFLQISGVSAFVRNQIIAMNFPRNGKKGMKETDARQ